MNSYDNNNTNTHPKISTPNGVLTNISNLNDNHPILLFFFFFLHQLSQNACFLPAKLLF